MKILSTIAFLFLSIYMIQAQHCEPLDRYTNVEYFSSSQIDSTMDVSYGTAIDWEGNSTDLLLDIYYPSASAETVSTRPFILLIHGGSFLLGDKAGMQNDCRALAKKGYVTATIKYRLGWDTANPTSRVFAVYRAQQDAHAAMRYIVENAEMQKIDTSWMFIGGVSAGAVTSLNTVYSKQAEWTIGAPTVVNTLGPLDTSGNNLTHSFTIKGVYNNWGAVPSSVFNLSEMIPTISIHGVLDMTVDINESDGLLGSAIIHESLLDNGICSELIVDSLGGHGVYGVNANWTSFRSDRASCFFKSIFCDDCNSAFLSTPTPANCATPNNTSDLQAATDWFHIFPNPSQSQFAIKSDIQHFKIEIRNASGVLLQLIDQATSAQTVDVSHLPQGLYFVRAIDPDTGQEQIQKMIKG